MPPYLSHNISYTTFVDMALQAVQLNPEVRGSSMQRARLQNLCLKLKPWYLHLYLNLCRYLCLNLFLYLFLYCGRYFLSCRSSRRKVCWKSNPWYQLFLVFVVVFVFVVNPIPGISPFSLHLPSGQRAVAHVSRILIEAALKRDSAPTVTRSTSPGE